MESQNPEPQTQTQTAANMESKIPAAQRLLCFFHMLPGCGKTFSIAVMMLLLEAFFGSVRMLGSFTLDDFEPNRKKGSGNKGMYDAAIKEAASNKEFMVYLFGSVNGTEQNIKDILKHFPAGSYKKVHFYLQFLDDKACMRFAVNGMRNRPEHPTIDPQKTNLWTVAKQHIDNINKLISSLPPGECVRLPGLATRFERSMQIWKTIMSFTGTPFDEAKMYGRVSRAVESVMQNELDKKAKEQLKVLDEKKRGMAKKAEDDIISWGFIPWNQLPLPQP